MTRVSHVSQSLARNRTRVLEDKVYSRLPGILIDNQSRSCQFRSKCTRISKHYAAHTKLDGRFDVFAAVVNINSVTRRDSKSIKENLKIRGSGFNTFTSPEINTPL